MSYDKKAVRDFCDRWRDKGYEKGETQQFWLQALRAIGYQHADDVLFEHHLPSGGFIDVWIRDANVLIEQKSYGANLDDYDVRQNKKKTPLMQALDYVDELPRLEQPRFVVTCNFGEFRVYDRDKWSKSQLSDNAFEFTLDEFAEHPEYMSFITDPGNSRLEKEKQVSIKAGELIGRLYDMMREGYYDPDSEKSMHALNVLCVRLVFCLYCEDADLFVKDSFFNYLQNIPANQLRIALKRLFKALDTNLNDRDPYDVDVKIFPYVNGGLFREETEIPIFTEEAKQFLLEEVSAAIDWSQISPTIFGGIFESTLNPETRRSGGMHYTSPENIHKVIDPLFLDDLKREFDDIKNEDGATPRKRKNALLRFHEKLCGLKFLDPACGSGNFLTEIYICLRRLEDLVLAEIHQGQSGLSFGEDEDNGRRISLNQFYGIEINDFAVTVAETALWISRLKANGENFMFYEVNDDDFPLRESAHIVEGNALRIDWNDILSASECSYIMGNPPFIGSKYQSQEQRSDILNLNTGLSDVGLLDYVSGWYFKAAEYCGNKDIKCAFVSTNSISQGIEPSILWRYLFDKYQTQILFAYRTFVWGSEAADQASVHCVIIGFNNIGWKKKKALFFSDGTFKNASNISPYLIDAPNVLISKRLRPLCDVPPMIAGNKAVKCLPLTLTPKEKEQLIKADQRVRPYIKKYIGSKEFINSQERYCLWLVDCPIELIYDMPLVKKRVEDTRVERLSSSDKQSLKLAEKPWLFRDLNNPKTAIVVPLVSSQRRQYIPIGYIDDSVIANNKVSIIPNGTLYQFGVLTSQFHNAFMRVVAMRMKSDYSYSLAIVYNNFIWPNPTIEQRKVIETCAKSILDIRDNYSNKSLASLYDPNKMPGDLLAAHKALDTAVEFAYGVNFDGDEEKIVRHLFELYAAAN